MSRQNLIHHFGNLYTAYTQAGFNKAIWNYFKEEGYHTKKEVFKMLQNYPTKYPCTFTIVDQTFECGRIYLMVGEISNLRHE